MGKPRQSMSISQGQMASEDQSWSWILAYRAWALSTAPVDPDAMRWRGEKASTRCTLQKIHLQADSLGGSPSFTSLFCRWCAVPSHCSSAPLLHPYPSSSRCRCDFGRLNKWLHPDTLGNSCSMYFLPLCLFWSSRKHILISAESILIFPSTLSSLQAHHHYSPPGD